MTKFILLVIVNAEECVHLMLSFVVHDYLLSSYCAHDNKSCKAKSGNAFMNLFFLIFKMLYNTNCAVYL